MEVSGKGYVASDVPSRECYELPFRAHRWRHSPVCSCERGNTQSSCSRGRSHPRLAFSLPLSAGASASRKRAPVVVVIGSTLPLTLPRVRVASSSRAPLARTRPRTHAREREMEEKLAPFRLRTRAASRAPPGCVCVCVCDLQEKNSGGPEYSPRAFSLPGVRCWFRQMLKLYYMIYRKFLWGWCVVVRMERCNG